MANETENMGRDNSRGTWTWEKVRNFLLVVGILLYVLFVTHGAAYSKAFYETFGIHIFHYTEPPEFLILWLYRPEGLHNFATIFIVSVISITAVAVLLLGIYRILKKLEETINTVKQNVAKVVEQKEVHGPEPEKVSGDAGIIKKFMAWSKEKRHILPRLFYLFLKWILAVKEMRWKSPAQPRRPEPQEVPGDAGVIEGAIIKFTISVKIKIHLLFLWIIWLVQWTSAAFVFLVKKIFSWILKVLYYLLVFLIKTLIITGTSIGTLKKILPLSGAAIALLILVAGGWLSHGMGKTYGGDAHQIVNVSQPPKKPDESWFAALSCTIAKYVPAVDCHSEKEDKSRKTEYPFVNVALRSGATGDSRGSIVPNMRLIGATSSVVVLYNTGEKRTVIVSKSNLLFLDICAKEKSGAPDCPVAPPSGKNGNSPPGIDDRKLGKIMDNSSRLVKKVGEIASTNENILNKINDGVSGNNDIHGKMLEIDKKLIEMVEAKIPDGEKLRREFDCKICAHNAESQARLDCFKKHIGATTCRASNECRAN